MRATRLTIKSVLGLEEFDITLGTFTKIESGNGQGKTSVVDAVKSLIEGGHDATLLRNGAEKGEVVLVLDDGAKIREQITARGTKRDYFESDGTKLRQPKTMIDSLVDSLSVNPIAFLTAKRDERARVLLETLPLAVKAEQLEQLTGRPWDQGMTTGHALIVLDKAEQTIFDERTAQTRIKDQAKAAAAKLKETLPPAPDADYAALVAVEREKLTAIEVEHGNLQAHIGGLLANEKLELQQKLANDVEGCRAADAQHDEEIRRLEALIAEQRAHKAAIARQVQEFQAEHDRAVEDARSAANRDFESRAGSWEVNRTTIRAEIARLEDLISQHARATGTRQMIADCEHEYAQAEEKHDYLTGRLNAIEVHRRSLLDKLPIDGLSVKEGQIYIDGVAFDRLNKARQVGLALSVAKLRAGKLGLVLVDNAECLDPETFAGFEAAAQESGLQFIVTKVGSGEMKVTAK